MYEMEYNYLKINNVNNRSEQWANACIQMFLSPYFGFLILTIILSYSSNNWKKPIYKVMILHWIIRALGEGFKCASTLSYYNDTAHDYSNNSVGMIKRFVFRRDGGDGIHGEHEEILYSANHWKYAQGFGSSLNYIGQIIGDWYLYLRTKTIVDNRKKMLVPLITLILFNIAKASQIFHFFVLNHDYYQKSHHGVSMTELIKFKSAWWIINVVIFALSFLYEISILYTLKKNVFKELKEVINNNESSFLSKFKKVSLYRLYITTFISVVALFFLFIFVLGTGNINRNETYIEGYRGEPVGMDSLQDYAININYYMIYIDQILLKNISNDHVVKSLNQAQ